MKHFLFTSGYYSDYYISALYVTDQDVDASVFDAMQKQFEANYKIQSEQSIIAFGERTGIGHNKTYSFTYGPTVSCPQRSEYHNSPEYASLKQWRKDNDAKELFKAKYHLVPVEYVECWSD